MASPRRTILPKPEEMPNIGQDINFYLEEETPALSISKRSRSTSDEENSSPFRIILPSEEKNSLRIRPRLLTEKNLPTDLLNFISTFLSPQDKNNLYLASKLSYTYLPVF